MLVSLTNINKIYNGKHILKNLCLTIENTDRIGLVGINGCGKTTLLKIITGKELPDKFTDEDSIVSFSSKVSLGYLEQAGGLDNSNTVIDEMKDVFSELLNVQNRMRELEHLMTQNKANSDLNNEYSKLCTYFETNNGYNIDVKIKTVLNGMGFNESLFNRLISSFSGGEQTRLAISKLLLEEPNLLILDEPTNHLDFKTVQWLEEYLKSYKGALLIVSHDRYFLDNLCTSICEIENGSLTRYKGNYSSFTRLKAEQTARRIKEYEKQQKEIAKLEDYVARNIARASTAKSAQSRVKALERMEITEKPAVLQKTAKINFDYNITPPFDLLSVKNLNLEVGDADKHKILAENIAFEVKRGEKIAVIGDNGTGKSTLLKALMGKIKHKGTVKWAANVKISYFEQENTTLDRNNSVFDEIHRKYPALTDFDIRSLLGKVRLSGENVFKPIGVISGGERAKVRFAVMMLEKGNVLILDEPTNHLDITTKEVIEQALDDFDGTVIFVSHDRYLINKIATKIIEISNGNTEIYNGGFNLYTKIQKERKAIAQNLAEAEKQIQIQKQNSEKKANSYRSKQQRSLDAQRRNTIKQLEKEIDELQQNINNLQTEITDPNVCADFKLLNEKCQEIENLKSQMEQKFEKLIELE